MRRGKRVFEIGRLRVAVMYGSRYRFGFDLTAGLGVCVITGLVRNG